MKNRTLRIIMLLTAIFSSCIAVIKFYYSGVFNNLVCFPFEQIGFVLRHLSLQGGIQNMIAIFIYIVLCLSPLVPLLLRLKKKSSTAEDTLMVVLSLLLFYVMYMMINPGLIPLPSASELVMSMSKPILCGTVYSVIITYSVLCAVRFFFISETKILYQCMVILLSITAALFTISIFGVGLSGVLNQINNIMTTNKGSDSDLGLTYLFVVIKFMIDSVSSFVSIFVIFSGITFTTELSSNPYSDETMTASKNLQNVCRIGLIVTVCSSTTFNLLQILYMSKIRNINSFIQIPLFSIIFIIGVIIFSKMVIANKSLKDDNDSII
ncbi:MAG: hypothetical protein ACRDA4_03220 [Filifactoraceae bacterium]